MVAPFINLQRYCEEVDEAIEYLELQGFGVSRISLAVVPRPKRSISAVSLERGCYHQEAGIYEEANFGEAETL